MATFSIGDSVTWRGEDFIVWSIASPPSDRPRTLWLRRKWRDISTDVRSAIEFALEDEVVAGPALPAVEVGDKAVVNGQAGTVTELLLDGRVVVETSRPPHLSLKVDLGAWRFTVEPWFLALGAHP